MLKNAKTFSSFSVDDLEKAGKFYGETLGLEVKREGEMGLAIQMENGMNIFIYPKPDHQPASFTVFNFQVENIDRAVDELRSRGVQFEQYGGALQADEKGVFRSDSPEKGPNIAWFKDPAGNVLSVLQP